MVSATRAPDRAWSSVDVVAALAFAATGRRRRRDGLSIVGSSATFALGWVIGGMTLVPVGRTVAARD